MERNSKDFLEWFVGMTDGDGCFSIYYNIKQNKLNFIFKISLSLYNIRALFFIRKHLGVGTIVIEHKSNMGSFLIRNKKIIESVIFPIFDKYSLLTTKFFYYLRFKKIFTISQDKTINPIEKKNIILNLLNQKPCSNYVSPIWYMITKDGVTLPTSSTSIKQIMSKGWLVGFIEAEGSFYITKKDTNRLVHGFGISLKLDKIVLESIRRILHFSTQVRFREPLLQKHGNHTHFFILDTTHKRSISNVCNYFEGNLKTIKSLEFKIWKKSFLENTKNSLKPNGYIVQNESHLLKTQTLLRKLRKTRPNINLIKSYVTKSKCN